MRTSSVTEDSVVIWLSGEECGEASDVTALLRRTLREAGLTPWESAEAELFADGDETLLVARRRRRLYLSFPDLEALLGAAALWGGGASSLYALPEGYLLALEETAFFPGLCEFGRPEEPAAEWETFAREQGLCLLRENAMEELRRCFGAEASME